MSPEMMFGLGSLCILLLVGGVVWGDWRWQCPIRAPNGRTLCARQRGHAGRHLTQASGWVEFDEPRTPNGRSCPHHGMNDDDLDDYEREFNVPQGGEEIPPEVLPIRRELAYHGVYFDDFEELAKVMLRRCEESSVSSMVAMAALLRLHDGGLIDGEALTHELARINCTVEDARALIEGPRLTPEEETAFLSAVKGYAELLAPHTLKPKEKS